MTSMSNGLPSPAPADPPSGVPVPEIAGRIPIPAPPAPAPRRPSPNLGREQILDATLDALRENGYDGATIRNIAKRLGCAVGSIYRYFPDKRTLLQAVTHRLFEPIVRQIEAGASIDATATAYTAAAEREPEMYRLMFWLSSVGQPAAVLPPVVEQILDGWANRLADRRRAERFWSQLHGCLMLGRPLNDAAATPARPTSPTPVILQSTPPTPSSTRTAAEDMTLL